MAIEAREKQHAERRERRAQAGITEEEEDVDTLDEDPFARKARLEKCGGATTHRFATAFACHVTALTSSTAATAIIGLCPIGRGPILLWASK